MARSLPLFPDDVPVMELVRISPAKLQAGDEAESLKLFDAAIDSGFFLFDLRDLPNGADALAEVDKAFELGEGFFNEPLETKKEYKFAPGNTGYKPLGVMKLANGKTDLTEVCAVPRDTIRDPDAYLPKVFARERPFLTKTAEDLHALATLVIDHLAKHLDIPASALHEPHDPSKPSSTVLRFLHTVPQPSPEKQTSLLGHTDSGSVTVLFGRLGGLQVLPPDVPDDADDAAWRWVRPEPGCAVVNVADALVHWTGGLLRSGFHRVQYAPGAQAAEQRYSFGYFLKPHFDARMAVIRQGSVIPRPEEEEEAPRYADWHSSKTANVMQGNNGRSRGGLGAARKAALAVQASA